MSNESAVKVGAYRQDDARARPLVRGERQKEPDEALDIVSVTTLCLTSFNGAHRVELLPLIDVEQKALRSFGRGEPLASDAHQRIVIGFAKVACSSFDVGVAGDQALGVWLSFESSRERVQWPCTRS